MTHFLFAELFGHYHRKLTAIMRSERIGLRPAKTPFGKNARRFYSAFGASCSGGLLASVRGFRRARVFEFRSGMLRFAPSCSFRLKIDRNPLHYLRGPRCSGRSEKTFCWVRHSSQPFPRDLVARDAQYGSIAFNFEPAKISSRGKRDLWCSLFVERSFTRGGSRRIPSPAPAPTVMVTSKRGRF